MSRWKSHVSLAVAVVLSIDLFAILALGGGTPVAVAVRLLAVAAILWLWLRWRILSDRFLFALILLFLLSVYHFHATTNRRVADGFFYYAYVQSFWKDFDLHFDDEYAEYGMDERGSRFQPTVTGHARNTFPAGPAIFWSPFFLLGELVGRAKMLFSDEAVNLSGGGRLHWNAVSLGSLIYGFAAVVLVYSSLRRYFLP
ncbi:MAG TPA: hypothetical protein VEK15_11610, partial [Vicinamibacteria bacterium]|nr:hypothetical protein [Vicinamibacteria bacterium]